MTRLARSGTLSLAAALAAIFGVKLLVLLQLGGHPLLQPTAAGGLDSQYYLQLAQRVAGGDLLLAPGLYFVSPLYIYFLAALLTLGGGSLFFVKLVQIGLGTAAGALAWGTTREWFSSRAAWLTLVLATLTGVFTFYEILILQAALDPFLTALDAFLVARALRAGGRAWPALSGAALAVHALNRPNMLLVAVGLACLWFARRGTRRLAPWFAAGIVVALLPIAARNAAAAGTVWPAPSHGGLNLYIGNNPAADGTYHSVPGITPNIAGQADDARRVAERATGRRLTDTEVSSYFTGRAVAWWRTEPGAASRLFLRKLAYTLNRSWLTLNYSYPFYRDESAILRALALGPLVLVPVGLIGLFAHAIVGRSTPQPFWAWAALLPLTVASIAIFFVASRYRVPLLVLLCVTGGGALDALLGAFAARRAAALATAAAFAVPLTVLAAWDFGLDDGRRQEATQMALAMIDRKQWEEADAWIARARMNNPNPGRFEVTIGQALAEAGRPAEAIPHLEEARHSEAWSDDAAIALVTSYASVGRTGEAVAVLESQSRGRGRAASTQIVFGRLAMQLGRPSVAERFFRSATDVDPSDVEAFEQLGLTLAGQGRWNEAIEALQHAVRLAPAQAPTRLNLAVAYAEAGRRREARDEALRALAADPAYQRAKDFLAALGRP